MRLLMISAHFPPSIGGIQNYSFELAKNFSKLCNQFEVIAPYQFGCDNNNKESYPLHRLPYIHDGFALSGIAATAHFIQKMKAQAIFCANWACGFSALSARKLVNQKIPVFTAVHGREVIIQPLRKLYPAQIVYNRMRQFAIQSSDVLLPVSDYTKNLLSDYQIKDNQIYQIPNGVNTDFYRPMDISQLRHQLGLKDKRVILTLSRLIERKGIDTVIDSVNILVKKFPDLIYLIVGEGPDKSRLKNLIEKYHLENHIRMIGSVSSEQVVQYYNLCDLFVMPARSDGKDVEGFGLVFLEANACAKPVIGAKVGGVVDAIQHEKTGLLVEPNNPEHLAHAIDRLLSDQQFAETMGKNGRAYVEKNATWKITAKRMIELMNERINKE